MNDPTVDVADPRGLNGVDLKIDLSRHARPELWAKYQALAGNADPFKVSGHDWTQAGRWVGREGGWTRLSQAREGGNSVEAFEKGVWCSSHVMGLRV